MVRVVFRGPRSSKNEHTVTWSSPRERCVFSPTTADLFSLGQSAWTDLGHTVQAVLRCEHSVKRRGTLRDEISTYHSFDFFSARRETGREKEKKRERERLEVHARKAEYERNGDGRGTGIARARAITSMRKRSPLSREFLPILRGLLFGPRVSPSGERISR